jgi:hypothetical protein
MVNENDIFTSSYDDNILFPNFPYIIGMNDSTSFQKVTYRGSKMFGGKNMMVFTTNEGDNLMINPSYLSFALENPSDINNKKEEKIGETINNG